MTKRAAGICIIVGAFGTVAWFSAGNAWGVIFLALFLSGWINWRLS